MGAGNRERSQTLLRAVERSAAVVHHAVLVQDEPVIEVGEVGEGGGEIHMVAVAVQQFFQLPNSLRGR